MKPFATMAQWLNANEGVLAVLVPLVFAMVGGAGRILFLEGRNPEAPTYGKSRPLADWATSLRARLASRSTASRPGDDEVVIGHFGFAFDYLPLFVARKRGFFERTGQNRKVKLRSFASYEALKSAIDNKEIQLVALSSVPATRLRCSGSNIVAIETLSAHAQCIVTPFHEVSVMRDLQYSQIATVEFSSSHFGALASLEGAGLEVGPNRFTYVDESEGRQLLRKREISAWAIWPLHSDYEIELTAAREVIGSEVPIYSVLVVVEGTADQMRFIARWARDAVRTAKTWISANEEQAMRFAQREFGVPKRVVRAAWRRFAFSAPLNEDTAADLRRNSLLMAKYGWFSVDKTDRLNSFVRSI